MKNLLVIGVATDIKIKNFFDKFVFNNDNYKKVFFVSTKKVIENRKIIHLIINDIKIKEKTKLDLYDIDEIFVVQNNLDLLSHMNIYEFLHYNDFSECSIVSDLNSIKHIELKKFFKMDFDTEKEHFLSYEDIEYAGKQFSVDKKGIVVDGEWDTLLEPFCEKYDFYFSFSDVINGKKEWNETDFFKNNINGSDQEESVEFLEMCKNLEKKFFSIKKNEMVINDIDVEPVCVNLDRFGRILFNSGVFLLTFAKLLKIKKIPVKIVARHKNWTFIRNKILKYIEVNKYLYAPIEHIEFDNNEALHIGRIDKILSRIKGNTVLDIGSHWGYICDVLERNGKNCVAVEANLFNYSIINYIKRAKRLKFKVYNENIFSFYKRISEFDTVIALNIFHHFLKNENDYIEFKSMLKELKIKEMFFEAHNYNEFQMKDSFINYSPEEFVDFILENSQLKYYEEIGNYNERKLYYLYR
ncbi:MAG: hypothetical protein M0R46_01690 [Candidatus Muirbacterium halophilum]|nr:hypothetical protein [Candidatus Muirbacterium halophilum]MCK9474607.1 hypothetical protein [Candidatus Muirbacterium halophilum]